MAQIGSALPWGGRGRRFKSCHSDQNKHDNRAVYEENYIPCKPLYFATTAILRIYQPTIFNFYNSVTLFGDINIVSDDNNRLALFV